MVVWGNENGQAFYRSVSEANGQNEYLTKFGASVSDIAFSRTGEYLAITSYDKTIRVYQLPRLLATVPLVLTDNSGPVTSVFFTTDNKLAAVISPGTVKLYELNLEKMAALLKPGLREMSQREKDLYLEDQATGNP
jgi:WD40 repeat protein